MPGDLQKKPDLLIVSDTPMWQKKEGNLAFEPVVREIENFYPVFDKITWIGFRQSNSNIQDSAVSFRDATVYYIFLDKIGGKGIISKINMLIKIPGQFLKIFKYIKNNDVVHARGPSVPALFALLISFIYKKPVYWYKYAGNWDLKTPPTSYRIQRDILKKAKQVIGTINGKWPGQQKHLLTFENPCFTGSELVKARAIADNKNFNEALTLLFVGRIEESKGFDRLLLALSNFDSNTEIEKIYFVGGGVKKAFFEQQAKEKIIVPYEFTGPLKRDRLNEIYGKSHIFCLPSLSEGFPKVLAESAAFGCVPIVSDLSCIGQYIYHKENGLLLKEISAIEIEENIRWVLSKREEIKFMSQKVAEITDKFTYEYYTQRINSEILKNSE